MKQFGYAALFFVFAIIIIPTILVKSCSQQEITVEPQPKKQEVMHSIRVYMHEEDTVVEMNFNEYLKGVVAAEMPASFEEEALKAQAVAARTYAYRRLNMQNKNNEILTYHQGADICTNSLHCKAWVSKKDAMDKWGLFSASKYWGKISQAVDETTNIIITYDTQPIDAVFHSTSSGRTENAEDVWSNPIPYLRSVVSEGEEYSPRYQSTVSVTHEEFQKKFLENRAEILFSEDITSDIGAKKRTEGGNVGTILIGNQNFRGTEIRSIFNLNAANFKIELEEDMVHFHVTGNGHGVGMSQYGANYLANQGKSYEEILKTYYSNIEIIEMMP